MTQFTPGQFVVSNDGRLRIVTEHKLNNPQVWCHLLNSNSLESAEPVGSLRAVVIDYPRPVGGGSKTCPGET